jgi:hypothetical protein
MEYGVIVERGKDFWTRNYLLTDRDFADFGIRFEVALDRGGGCGIALRGHHGEELPERNAARMLGHPLFKLTDGPKRELSGTTH